MTTNQKCPECGLSFILDGKCVNLCCKASEKIDHLKYKHLPGEAIAELERIAIAQEKIAELQEKTLQAYNATNCETLKAMDAREAREIMQARRAAERHEWDRETYKKQQELIQAKIDEANRYIK